MSEGNSENIVYSKSVIEFATVANEYCNFLESQQGLPIRQFLSTLQKLLPFLYLKISMVPRNSSDEFESPEKYLNEIDYNFLLNRLSVKLGSYDGYLEVFDPGIQFSETPIESNISENLCDIYQDLKDFIFAYRVGTPDIMTDSLWECKKNFEEFWGQKLVNVLRAIHSLLFSDILLDENKEFSIGDDLSRDKNWVSKHFTSQTDEETGF